MSDESGSGGLTLGERIRKIEDDSAATREIVSEINGRGRADLVRMATMARDIDKKADSSAVIALDKRVTELESSLTWAWRTATGALIAAAIGLLIQGAGG